MRDLFEDLREAMCCDYISDLKYYQNSTAVVCAALRFEPSNYKLSEWNDLVDYIFSEKREFASYEAVKEYLVKEYVSKEIR